MPSYYVPDLKEDTQSLVLEDDEFHHLTRVARHKSGDHVVLNSGKGFIAKAELTDISKKSLRLEIIDLDYSPPPHPGFALAFSLLKGKHDEIIIEKVTELGVSHLLPIVSEHSVRQESKNAQQRFERIALAAIKQCDNPWLPKIESVLSLEKAIHLALEQGYIPLVCSERKPQIWLHDLDLAKYKPACFFIGAEGGWSEAEYFLFEKLQISEISISNLILRAETAAICIAAQWNMYQHSRRNQILK